MYCKKCGSKLNDTDQFCHICGTWREYEEPQETHRVQSDKKEEVVFNPPVENKSMADTELRFASEDRTETEKDEPSEPVRRSEELKVYISQSEIEATQKTEARKPAAHGAEFDWNIHDFPKEPKKTEKIDFNWNMDEFSEQDKKAAESEVFEEELFQEIRDDEKRIKEQNIDRFFTFSKKNEEFQALLDQEFEKFKTKPLIIPAEPEEAPVPNFEVPVIEDEPAMEVPAAVDRPEVETAMETEDGPEAETAMETEDGPEAETIIEEESIIDEPAIAETEASIEPEPAAESEPITEPYPAAEGEFQPSSAAAIAVPASATMADPAAILSEIFAETEPEDFERKKGFWHILLIIIAVILVLEIGILGIRYFAPDSKVAAVIGNAQTQVIKTVSGWSDSIKELFSGKDSDEGTIPPEDVEVEGNIEENPGTDDLTETPATPIPDPNPMADKNALVASQAGLNSNITQIRANDALKYEQGENYGIADINNSKPIQNNIWQTPENGEPVYYDRSVVGTIISFDSQWIDYVNDGNKAVLDLTKKSSEAYRKTEGFSKIGKIKETFKLLEIGEIRQGEKGFYVWAHEEIQITENGKDTNKIYNWIYSLEPVEGKMQIVNYFNLN